MTNKDLKEFTQLLVILAEVNRQEISPGVIKQYYNDLDDFPLDTLKVAIKKARMTLKFFPKITELRELCITDTRPLPADAWIEVKRQISDTCGVPGAYPKYSHPAIAAAVNSLGGISAIWEAGTDKESFYRRDFVNAYNDYSDRDHQQEMIGQGEAKQIMQGIQKRIGG